MNALRKRYAQAVLAGFACLASEAGAGTVDATYSITLAGLTIGRASLSGVVENGSYNINVSAALTGLMGAITQGSGSGTARGGIGSMAPLSNGFAVTATNGSNSRTVQIGASSGNVRGVTIEPPLELPMEGRIPLREQHKQGVVDPISALVMPVRNGNPLDKANCERRLPVFDGTQRFDVVLTFAGVLTVMCGGDPAAFDAVRPVAMAFSRAVTLLGPSGAGQLTKMVNQICIAGLVQGLSEAIAFGQRAGLDMHQVLDVLGKGAAQSWQMDNRGKTMVEGKFDFGFAVDWMRKDLGLVLDEAKRNGSRLPVTALVDQFYADVQKMGGNRWDTSSLIKRLK